MSVETFFTRNKGISWWEMEHNQFIRTEKQIFILKKTEVHVTLVNYSHNSVPFTSFLTLSLMKSSRHTGCTFSFYQLFVIIAETGFICYLLSYLLFTETLVLFHSSYLE
jgi:hypothetical protein